MLKGISLFACAGIDEYYFKNYGVEIVVSNELVQKRCDFYSHIYPQVDMVCGDITDKNIFKCLLQKYKENKCDFLIATPPCQGMSQAGKMNEKDNRNKLIIDTINFIKNTRPSNIIIENVPQILQFSILVNNKKIKIIDFIENELIPLGYKINYSVLDCADYNTAQHRKRAIFLISKIKKWEFPKKVCILMLKK